MKSWIHEISESYVSGHKPVRRDIKENYVQLNEEQRFGLLSENVLNYLDEQLQNAFGFGMGDLTEEELYTILEAVIGAEVADRVAKKQGKKLTADEVNSLVQDNLPSDHQRNPVPDGSVIDPTGLWKTGATGSAVPVEAGEERNDRKRRAEALHTVLRHGGRKKSKVGSREETADEGSARMLRVAADYNAAAGMRQSVQPGQGPQALQSFAIAGSQRAASRRIRRGRSKNSSPSTES